MQCISKVYLFVKMKVSNEILTAETYSNAIHYIYCNVRNTHVCFEMNELSNTFLYLIFVQQLQSQIFLTFSEMIKVDLELV